MFNPPSRRAAHPTPATFPAGPPTLAWQRDEGAEVAAPQQAMTGPCDVLHVSSVHPYDDVRILYRECMVLRRAGIDVRAAFFDVRKDQLGGVPLIDMGPRPRSRLARAWTATRRMAALVKTLRPRAVHVHDPELLPLALLLKRRGCVVFYDAHEDLPQQIFHKHWIPRLLRGPFSRLAAWLLPGAFAKVDGLVVAARHIHDTTRLDHQRVVLRNMPIRRRPGAGTAEQSFDERERAAAYVGAITAARDTAGVVRAALGTGCTVYLAGHADPGYLAEICALDDRRVHYLGVVAPPDVARLLDRCRVGLAVLPPTPAYREAVPSKLFDYLKAGLPLALSDFPAWRADLGPELAPYAVDPHDGPALTRLLQRLLDDEAAWAQAKRGVQAVAGRYPHADEESARLVEMVRHALGRT